MREHLDHTRSVSYTDEAKVRSEKFLKCAESFLFKLKSSNKSYPKNKRKTIISMKN